jgi:hypothetical protein
VPPLDSRPLRALRKNFTTLSCEARPLLAGIQVRLLWNDRLHISHLVATGDDALDRAEEKREQRLVEGWRAQSLDVTEPGRLAG